MGECLLTTDPALAVTVPVAPTAEAPVPAPDAAPPPHLSPSSATMFRQCPRRWRHRYIERLEDPAGPAALVGTLAHRVLELLLNEPAGDRNLDRARNLAGEAWPAHAAHPEFARLGLDPDATREFKWRVWRAIEGLWQLEDPATVDVRATEQRLEVQLHGVPFVGIVDRVDHGPDGLVITDYKSGQPPRPAQVEEKLDQVLLYAGAVAAATGEQPARARLLYLGATIIEAEATPAAVGRAAGRLRDTWDTLEAAQRADEFPAQPGPLCGWCPFLDRCSAGRTELQARADAGWFLPATAPGVRVLAA
jgi:putative RecB family exonuclease